MCRIILACLLAAPAAGCGDDKKGPTESVPPFQEKSPPLRGKKTGPGMSAAPPTALVAVRGIA